MRVVVYLALLGALIMCLPARRAARHLSPPLAVLTLAGSALLAAAAWAWNLALLSGTLIGQLTYVADVGHWSGRAIARHDPVPTAAAGVAGLLIVIAVLGLGRCLCRASRELLRIWAAARACPRTTGDGVLVVDDPAPRALAVPGVRGRVLVTTGIVKVLSAEQRRVLFAHERAHLRYRHGEIRLLVRLAAGVLPILSPMVRDCDYQLERWADEAAALAVADRRLTARALAQAALSGRPRKDGFPAGGLAFTEHSVTSRVRALLADPPSNDLRRLVLPVFVLAGTAVLSMDATFDLENLFELARHLWPT